MNISKLKGKIVEREMTMSDLAEKVGIDRATLYRKFNEFDKFTIGEALKIKTILNLSDTDAIEIFLS